MFLLDVEKLGELIAAKEYKQKCQRPKLSEAAIRMCSDK